MLRAERTRNLKPPELERRAKDARSKMYWPKLGPVNGTEGRNYLANGQKTIAPSYTVVYSFDPGPGTS